MYLHVYDERVTAFCERLEEAPLATANDSDAGIADRFVGRRTFRALR